MPAKNKSKKHHKGQQKVVCNEEESIDENDKMLHSTQQVLGGMVRIAAFGIGAPASEYNDGMSTYGMTTK